MDKNLIEALAKVVIAAAWADQKMAAEEINSLKDLLFKFQRTITMADIHPGDQLSEFLSGFYPDKTIDAGIGIPAREMAKFEMYAEASVDAAERAWLVNQLCDAIRTEEDKALIISALRAMAEADGVTTEAEQAVLNEIKSMIETVDTGIFDALKRFFLDALQRRTQKMSSAPNREKYFEEFLSRVDSSRSTEI